jgi:hypothetical protein
MFSRKACYFFVRPKTKYLELCVMLGRPLKAPQVRSVIAGSKTKFAHMIRITHRDEVEAPITDWLHEAYRRQDVLAAARSAGPSRSPVRRPPKRRTAATHTRKKASPARKKASRARKKK